MAASYPISIRSFSTKRNILDIVDASDPNGLQEEVVAIEATLGVNPNVSTSPSSSGTFAVSSTSYSSVSARLANIETGIVSDSQTQYIRRTGNETLVNAVASTVALIIKGATGQSVSLQEWKNASNTTVAKVDNFGTITANSLSSPEIDNQIIASLWG